MGSKGIIIEIKDNEVRGLLFSSFFGRIKISRQDTAPIENGGIAAALEGLLSSFPSHIPVTLILPGRLFMVRKLTVPFTDRKKIRKILPYEMDGILPVQAGEIYVDSLFSSPSGSGSDVIALAITRKLLSGYINLFPENRRPSKVVPDFLSLLSIGTNIGAEEGIYGIIGIGKGVVSMVFISERRPVLFRSVHVSDIPRLLEVVKTSINSITDEEHRIERLYVTGAGATKEALQGLSEMKEAGEILSMPHIVKNISLNDMPTWVVAAGAAIAEAEYPWFNILGASAESEHYENFFKTLSLGIAILFIVLTGSLYIRYHVDTTNYYALKAESRKLFMSIMPEIKNVVKEEVQLKNFLNKENTLKEALAGKPAPSYIAALNGLEGISRGRSDIKIREISFDGYWLAVAGDGLGAGADSIKKMFSDMKGLKGVQVEEIIQGIGSNNYRFRVRMELSGAPATAKK